MHGLALVVGVEEGLPKAKDKGECNMTRIEARRVDREDDWGVLQTFTRGTKEEQFEAAHQALRQWLSTWHDAPSHEFRIQRAK
jgi:hypothetical protein